MNLTNLHGLPEAVVAAVRNDSYVGGGDISATKLIDTPQRRVLQRQFKESVVEDVSERIWALLGQLAHLLLERANTNDLVEQRLYMNVNGWELSGQFDHVHLGEKMLSDYKQLLEEQQEGLDHSGCRSHDEMAAQDAEWTELDEKISELDEIYGLLLAAEDL